MELIKLTQAELDEKLRKHRLWLENAEGGERLCGAYDLSGLNMAGAYMAGANMADANMADANMAGANMAGANMARAYMAGANMARANMAGANMAGANMAGAYMAGANMADAYMADANMAGANMAGANMAGANMADAKNTPFIPIACPTHGEFTGWKKVGSYIIKLRIPEDAKRCSATTKKCRCDKALVLAIENLDGTDSGLTEILNTNRCDTLYKVGEMVYPDSFDENRFNECTHGIHFFVDRGEAERW